MNRFVWTAFVLVALILSVSVAAVAHQAPTGWEYDATCCSNQDCTIIKKVVHNPDGTMEVTAELNGTDYTVHVNLEEMHRTRPDRIRPSKDEYMHICINVNMQPPYVICIYLPAGT